ncbi:MAG TPA: hypothetical protein VGH86_15655, partial [Phenylobacterium sp.]
LEEIHRGGIGDDDFARVRADQPGDLGADPQRRVDPPGGVPAAHQPFAFEDGYRPATDIRAQITGTPPILGLAALEAGVDLQLEADPRAVEAKGRTLTDLFIAEVEARATDAELALVSPRDASARGLHVSFSHPQGYAVVQAMIARAVVGDFRAPDIARFGFSPLFLSYVEVWQAAQILCEVLATHAWDRPEFQTRTAVT